MQQAYRMTGSDAYLGLASVFRRLCVRLCLFVFAGGVRLCRFAIEWGVRLRPFFYCIRNFNDFFYLEHPLNDLLPKVV